MIKDITIGQYFPGESLIHRADPRTKIILTLLYMVAVFTTDAYLGFLAISIFTLIIIISSGIPIRYTLNGLKPVMFIILLLQL